MNGRLLDWTPAQAPGLRPRGSSLRRHLDHAATTTLLHEQVTADVRRAARLIDTGLRAFAAPA